MGELEGHEFDELSRFATDIVRRSGDKALSFYGKGERRVKFDERLVTEAELGMSDFFNEQLQHHFPEHQVFGTDQENKDYTHEEKRYLWIYDPLDGVANFQAGIPIWGVSLALLDNFWPILGVFYLPATGDVFHARAGEKAFRGDEEICIPAQKQINDESLLFTYSRFHLHYRSTFPGKIRDFGCTTAHICYVAMGRADAALIANESYQGLATARVIIEAAGGKIRKMDGGDFFLNEYLDGQKIDDHLLVSAPDTHAQVRQCLQEVAP
jgi:myo-inositol-1(or 4)-monophosphatase